MQISDAAYRWMVREENDKGIYVRSTLQVLLNSCIIASGCILAVHYFYPFRFGWYFVLVLVTARVLQTTQKLLRGLENQKLFAVSGILYTAIFLALNVIQICVLRQGVEALFQSTIIANIVTLFVVYVSEKRLRVNIFQRPDFVTIKKLLKFSIPLVPNQLNWWIINSSDRYVIRYFIGATANGIYAISYKFPTMLQVILNLFNTSWQDVSISDSDKDTGKYYSSIFEKLYNFSFSLLWCLIPATKVFINIFMDVSYHDAANYVSFLFLGTVFQSFSSFYGVGYLRDKNTKQASLTSIYGAIINAVVCIGFVRFIGLHAASISTFFGFAVMWLIREHQNRNELGVVINLRKFLSLFFVTFFISIIACFTNMAMDFAFGILGGIAFLVLNYKLIQPIVTKLVRKIRRH
jgi:O-antigen/teichoic acid export membrane protein